jgi:hypothetical protein
MLPIEFFAVSCLVFKTELTVPPRARVRSALSRMDALVEGETGEMRVTFLTIETSPRQ